MKKNITVYYGEEIYELGFSFLLKDFSKFTCKPRFGIFSPFRLNFYSLFKSKKFILLTQA